MTVAVKICGLKAPEAVDAAVEGGARLVGFVFFERTPRRVTPAEAAALAARVPRGVVKVGLVVDLDDAALADILAEAPLDLLQLHGRESPERVAEIKARFRVPVMKAVAVSEAGDLERAKAYEGVVDRLMFDAKPPAGAERPGGNAVPFDWSLLSGREWRVPWILAGGLDAGNVAQAVAVSGAATIDVSSGVEDAPGVKSPQKIREFLGIAARL
jgi:phosphoribosylanthranilate isomerase